MSVAKGIPDLHARLGRPKPCIDRLRPLVAERSILCHRDEPLRNGVEHDAHVTIAPIEARYHRLQSPRHLVQRESKVSKLVVSRENYAVVEMALADALRAVSELPDRPQDTERHESRLGKGRGECIKNFKDAMRDGQSTDSKDASKNDGTDKPK